MNIKINYKLLLMVLLVPFMGKGMERQPKTGVLALPLRSLVDQMLKLKAEQKKLNSERHYLINQIQQFKGKEAEKKAAFLIIENSMEGQISLNDLNKALGNLGNPFAKEFIKYNWDPKSLYQSVRKLLIQLGANPRIDEERALEQLGNTLKSLPSKTAQKDYIDQLKKAHPSEQMKKLLRQLGSKR